jgi:GDSL-like Lipase/Acylhydrolase family
MNARTLRGFAILPVIVGLIVGPISDPALAAKKKKKQRPIATTTTVRPAAAPDQAAPSTSTAAPVQPVKNVTITKKGSALGPVLPIVGRSIKIMPLGDDLTAGGGATGGQSYRGHLYNRLKALGYDVDFVGSQQTESAAGGDQDNEGHGAFTIGPDDNRFCSWPIDGEKDCLPTPFNISAGLDGWLDSAKPDVVIVEIGLYDLFEPSLKKGTDGLEKTFAPKEAPKRLRALVDQIRKSDPTRVIIVSSLLKPSWATTGWATYEALNAEAMKLGEASPDDLILSIDLAKLPIKKDEYLDGFHFNDAAAARVADQLSVLVTPVLDRLAGR